MEDGIEEDNEISFNLVAHVHLLLGPDGNPPRSVGQLTPIYEESEDLIVPADVTASGFYVSNVHNTIVGNAASGGWSGFVSFLCPNRDWLVVVLAGH